MKYRIFNRENSGDFLLTFIAIGIILLAAGITVGKVAEDRQATVSKAFDDPVAVAEEAAYAGIRAAKSHIECHGSKEKGALPRQFYANGGRFEVVWDNFDATDSTVHVWAFGYCDMPGIDGDNDWTYTTRLESVIKLDRINSESGKNILKEFYESNYHIKTEGQR